MRCANVVDAFVRGVYRMGGEEEEGRGEDRLSALSK